MSKSNSEFLTAILKRLKAGDKQAKNELFERTGKRLEHLARKMFHSYPALKEWMQTNDILHEALIKLLNALEAIHPVSREHFYSLAALQIRRVLIDMTRKFFGAEGPGKYLECRLLPDHPENTKENQELERWARFHEAVDNLSEEHRQVVSLIFYHGWTHEEVAIHYEVCTKTISRRWNEALLLLHQAIK